MNRIIFLTFLVFVLFGTGACQNDTADNDGSGAVAQEGQEETRPVSTAMATTKQGITWFDGSLEEAFATAQAESKPVFLYWGAVWCPPCHEIQATVFKSREFINRSTAFIPVYLDGDTDNAQQHGENFGVLGYPTMIVFNPQGKEITRIPGGSDIQAYASVLDLALNESQSVSSLFAHVMEEGGTLTAARCQLMAQYSWGQDSDILKDRDSAAVFLRLHDVCPQNEQSARMTLMLNHLIELIDASGEEGLSEEQKALGRKELDELLGDYNKILANIYTVLFDGARMVAAFSEPGTAERQELAGRFDAMFERVAEDTNVFRTERLYANIGKIEFERIDDPDKALSEELIAGIDRAVTLADQETSDPYERQTVMNAAKNVLNDAGMAKQSRALLEKEITISKQPYYFMVGLASIEQDEGDFEQAVYWLERAYNEAKGPATRFQWGVYYVSGLLEMKPAETDLIEQQTLKLIDELAENQAMYQRPRKQLSRLEKRLKSWQSDGGYADSYGNIQRGVKKICNRLAENEPSRDTCNAFLAST